MFTLLFGVSVELFGRKSVSAAVVLSSKNFVRTVDTKYAI
jgi:hypothetical protein